jgi:glycosyltransferase involved in cell wall biosynthesis
LPQKTTASNQSAERGTPPGGLTAPVDTGRALRIAILTAIFPPDIGGPASHAADLAKDLRDRGHSVEVITLGSATRTLRRPGIVRYPRWWPWPLRIAAVASCLIRRRQSYELIYATGLHVDAAVGAVSARRPLVAKVVGDQVWERARRLSMTSATFDQFERERSRSVRVRMMRAARNWSLRRARAVTVPSRYLCGVVERWLGGTPRPTLIYNRVKVKDVPTDRRNRGDDLQVVFVGRLVEHKRIDVVLEGLSRTDRPRLEVVGDGPDRERLRRRAEELSLGDRVEFTGALDHDTVVKRLAAADLLVIASEYEGLPHVAVEALACGTPIASVDVGGVREVVAHGTNGLIVESRTPDAFASVFRLLQDDGMLRRRLAASTRTTAARWRFERTVDELESLFRTVIRQKPRAVFLGKVEIDDPVPETSLKRLRVIGTWFAAKVLADGVPRRRDVGGTRVLTFPWTRFGPLSSVAYYALGPLVAVWLAAHRGPSVVVCQSPFEAFGCVIARRCVPPGLRPLLVVEVHGDWRASSRYYGGRLRTWIGPIADRVAVWTLRRADRVRVISDWLADRVREAGFRGALDQFPTFTDYTAFLEAPLRPPPDEPCVAFVGSASPVKGLDVLLVAWAHAARAVPGARLSIVGGGPLLDAARSQARRLGFDSRVAFLGPLSSDGVREVLDRSTCLVLPSRSEGMGRVILEAYLRARPVIATAVGGVPELVEEGRSGFLVQPDDPNALSNALIRMLSNLDQARAMGDEARSTAAARDPASQFEAGYAQIARWVTDARSRSAPGRAER